jgi:predicted 3-demethylubiquinone-9 3-methyltransferase (glyoxalase superfamily)
MLAFDYALYLVSRVYGATTGRRWPEEGHVAISMTPFLMFEGCAEAAMSLYVSLFRGSRIKQIERYGPGELGGEGSVKRADLAVAGQDLICIDSPIKHAFTFTPSVSLFVECEDEAEFDAVFDQLSTDGSVLMPPDHYGFSTRFAWVNDRFGVSRQLNLQ